MMFFLIKLFRNCFFKGKNNKFGCIFTLENRLFRSLGVSHFPLYNGGFLFIMVKGENSLITTAASNSGREGG